MSVGKLKYILHSGKNSKPKYFLMSYLRMCVPSCLLRRRLGHILRSVDVRADREYILDRVDYYNRLLPLSSTERERWAAEASTTASMPRPRQKVYYFDSVLVARWFPSSARWVLLPGDITFVPDVPSITKSRPIVPMPHDGGRAANANSVVLNLNKVRHFIFVDDKKPFIEKKDMAVFRGKVNNKPIRLRFMERYASDSRVDAGAIDNVRPEWLRPKMTIRDHLDYRYVMALEGNEVASNLKWIMSSNSIAVMPRPNYETWFMEGRLVPDYHYIEIKPDFSDLEERLDYYSSHPAEAQAIIDHAHEYVAQFMDRERERLISLLVMDKYFRMTGISDV